jgi:hypothetical protein
MDEGIFIDDLTDDSLISFSGTSDDNVAVYYDNESSLMMLRYIPMLKMKIENIFVLIIQYTIYNTIC